MHHASPQQRYLATQTVVTVTGKFKAILPIQDKLAVRIAPQAQLGEFNGVVEKLRSDLLKFTFLESSAEFNTRLVHGKGIDRHHERTRPATHPQAFESRYAGNQ